jgi:hypothetical protein
MCLLIPTWPADVFSFFFLSFSPGALLALVSTLHAHRDNTEMAGTNLTRTLSRTRTHHTPHTTHHTHHTPHTTHELV